MDEASITRFISETFDGVDVVVASREGGAPEVAWGDTFFSYDPSRQLPPAHRLPFATIVTKDYGDFDSASQLNRPGVFRLNIGVSKETYRSLFGPQPSPPPAGSAVETGHDFTALDQLMPHPVYATMSWVCVLSPSEATFEAVKPLLEEAYEMAVKRYNKSKSRAEP